MTDDYSEADDLLNLPRPKWPNHEIAMYGGLGEDDLAIAGGYIAVAELAAKHWAEHGPDDGLPIPILYNYRHGIELSLKWLIRRAARCIVRAGVDTKGENLGPAKLDEKLHTHNIKKLADRLDKYLGLLDIDPENNGIDQASRQLLDWLDSEDETGETFRYAVVGHGTQSRPARPQAVRVNFYEMINEVHKLANLLQAGYSGYLDDYEQNQIDYLDYQSG